MTSPFCWSVSRSREWTCSRSWAGRFTPLKPWSACAPCATPTRLLPKKKRRATTLPDFSVASFGGSWTFILSFLLVLVVYAAVNVALRKAAWDPYPFILLNLFLSMLAAIQAPVIMMSQNRQDARDRLRSELDFEVNRRSELEIQGLSRKLNLLGEQIADVGELLRAKLAEDGRTRLN